MKSLGEFGKDNNELFTNVRIMEGTLELDGGQSIGSI
jgi:hypothetical protein